MGTFALHHYHVNYAINFGCELCVFFLINKINRIRQKGMKWTFLRILELTRYWSWRTSAGIWKYLPAFVIGTHFVNNIGQRIHRSFCRWQQRTPGALYTRFLRNRGQMNILRSIISQKPEDSVLNIAVLGCSTGAELYSAKGIINETRPDLNVYARGIDISVEAIKKAEKGEYGSDDRELEGLREKEINKFFVRHDNILEVRPELKKNVTWQVGDACNPDLLNILGYQHIVFANNFLIHWPNKEAENCLSNIIKLLSANGFLFVWGVDPEVKMRVVQKHGLLAVLYHIEQTYTADITGLNAWPWKYWGLEPLDKNRADWKERYATVYKFAEKKRSLQIHTYKENAA